MRADVIEQPRIERLTLFLVLLCSIVWLWSLYSPHDFATWRMEQIATLLMLAVLFFLSNIVSLSILSRIGIAAIFCIHTIGTHYTYSLTPYNDWSAAVFGSSVNEWFGWTRNHYDRFVHLMYGACLTLPIIESLTQLLNLRTTACRIFSVQLVLATSALYELMEWAAAIVFGGDVGTAYLGTQGDVWDAQTDMALATAGNLLILSTLVLADRLGRADR